MNKEKENDDVTHNISGIYQEVTGWETKVIGAEVKLICFYPQEEGP